MVAKVKPGANTAELQTVKRPLQTDHITHTDAKRHKGTISCDEMELYYECSSSRIFLTFFLTSDLFCNYNF